MNFRQIQSSLSIIYDRTEKVITKSICLLLFVLVLFSCTTQKQFTHNKGHSVQSDYYSTIPFEWVRNKIIVPVEINGKTYRFLVDTGSSNAISERLQKELQYPILINQFIRDQSGKGDSLQIVEMKELAFGGVLFNNTPAIVFPDSTLLLQCYGVEGIIGSNMLRNSIIRFSLPEKTITVTDNSQKIKLNKKQSSKLWLTPMQSLPYFWVSIENEKKGTQLLLFDSGMKGLYSLSVKKYTNTFKKRKIFKPLGYSYGNNSYGLYGFAENDYHYKLLLPVMNINGMLLNNVVTYTTSNNNSRIGAEVFEHAIVTLDYINKRIYFEPLFEKEKDVYKKTYPVDPNLISNKLCIGYVWDENLLSEVSVGDQILSIDDTDCRELTPCDVLLNDLQSNKQDSMSLTIQKSNGDIHKIIIKKR